MCSNLIKLGDTETFEKITTLMLNELLDKIKIYNKEQTNHNYFIIKNYLIFFMIVTINLKNFPAFIKTIFSGKKQFFKTLIDSINTIPRKRKKEGLFSILNYLFLPISININSISYITSIISFSHSKRSVNK